METINYGKWTKLGFDMPTIYKMSIAKNNIGFETEEKFAAYCMEIEDEANKDFVFRRITTKEPYSKKNLIGNLYKKLEAQHLDVNAAWRAIEAINKNYDSKVWKTKIDFVYDVYNYHSDIDFSNIGFSRLDKTKPISWENMDFGMRDRRKKTDVISKQLGIGIDKRYRDLVRRGRKIDMTIEEFVDVHYDFAMSEKPKMSFHIHRIDERKPLSVENCYCSYRKDSCKTHGLSRSKIYMQYQDFCKKYSAYFVKDITLNKFFAKAMRTPDYKPDWLYEVNREKKVNLVAFPQVETTISMRDVTFKPSQVKKMEMKLAKTWKAIPESLNEFKDFDEFVKWSCTYGFLINFSMKKVRGEKYNSKNCVWDVFTEREYEEYRKMTNTDVCKKYRDTNTKFDYYYNRRANMKTRGPICDEWNDIEVFKAWCIKNNVSNRTTIKRTDCSKPFGPDNVIIKTMKTAA